MSEPWMKFYPRDWRGDQALRAVSIAARGLWIECLCIMHEAKPYGHLTLNGAPVDGDTLARMTGISVDEVSALLAELRQAGVLSVTGKGVVFSRRMTKDHARAQKGRISAKKRWSQVSDGVEQSDAPNGVPSRVPITQKPEARSQIAASQQTRASNLDLLENQLFEAAGIASFRDERHPRLKDLSPIRALMDKGYSLDGDILPVIRERSRNKTFNSWRFFEQAVIDATANKNRIPEKPNAQPVAEDWQNRMKVWDSDRTWSSSWGPKPGERGCRVPQPLNPKAA